MAGDNAGRRGSRYRLDQANQRAKHLPCWLCGQPIDYTLEWPNPGSFSLDHIKSWRHHPELRTDPANHASAHLKCNQSKGAGEANTSLGLISEQW